MPEPRSTGYGSPMNNVDRKTVEGFGDEWSRMDQRHLPDGEKQRVFEAYFKLFPWDALPSQPIGFDAGCGSGRWASLVAPRVTRLHCVDASDRALAVAQRNLAGVANVEFVNASVQDMPFDDASMDFGYSLGVLHHLPDTAAAIAACTRKLKPGAPFLLYLYYAFDNRPAWFRRVWKGSDLVRRAVSRLPHGPRYATSQVLAAGVYLPLSRTARGLERAGFDVASFPLAAYRTSSFYAMRTDALDRFGTRLERRFTRQEIEGMMTAAGLTGIRFQDEAPFWCAIGYRAPSAVGAIPRQGAATSAAGS
jgi:ubiquinone/menaquinone biosynthesis C-methylase UbiE